MFRWLQREPEHTIKRRQLLSDAFADYPLYQPPYRQGPSFPRRTPKQTEEDHKRLLLEFAERGRENFQYFLDQRTARLIALRTFLSKLGVNADLDDVGLAAVSAWFPGNLSALVANLRDEGVTQAFYQMNTTWTESLRGLNVLFDLGVFLGECLTVRQPKFRWEYHPGLSDDGASYHTGYVITGFEKPSERNWFDPAAFIYGQARNDVIDQRPGSTFRPVNAGVLAGKVRAYTTR